MKTTWNNKLNNFCLWNVCRLTQRCLKKIWDKLKMKLDIVRFWTLVWCFSTVKKSMAVYLAFMWVFNSVRYFLLDILWRVACCMNLINGSIAACRSTLSTLLVFTFIICGIWCWFTLIANWFITVLPCLCFFMLSHSLEKSLIRNSRNFVEESLQSL